MKRNQLVALVPSWLNDRLEATNASPDIITDFQKLTSTVSLQDVCFYVALQDYLPKYVGNFFDDMETVVTAPQNQVWLIENQRTLAQQREILSGSIARSEETLFDQGTPRTYRKTNYTAKAAGPSCLAIVGYGMFSEYSHPNFIEACVNVLHEQLTATGCQSFDVFREYVKVVQ